MSPSTLPSVAATSLLMVQCAPWSLALVLVSLGACNSAGSRVQAPVLTRVLELPGEPRRGVLNVHVGATPGTMLLELPGRDSGLVLCRRAGEGHDWSMVVGEGALAASLHPSTGQILGCSPGQFRGLEFRDPADLGRLDLDGSSMGWLRTQDVVDIAPGRDGYWVVLGIDGQLAEVSLGGRVAQLRDGSRVGSAHQIRHSPSADAYVLKWAASTAAAGEGWTRWVEIVDPHGEHIRSIECAAQDRSSRFAIAQGVLFQDDGIGGIARWDVATGQRMSGIDVPTGSHAAAQAHDFGIGLAADGSAMVVAWSWREPGGGAPWHSRVIWLHRSASEWVVADELSFDSARAATTIGVDAQHGCGTALVSSVPVLVWDVRPR